MAKVEKPIVDWGQYAITDPVEHKFKDKPEWSWWINPPTSGNELDMAKFLTRGKFFVGAEGMSREAAPTWVEIAHRELALTFGGTTIVDAEGKEVLKDSATVAQVEKFLKAAPHKVVVELWEALADAVPGWGGRQRADEEEDDPNE